MAMLYTPLRTFSKIFCMTNKYLSLLLLSGKTFWGLSVLVKIDLNLLFLSIIGYYRSFLVKIKCLQFETENQAPG
ncbi:hypothetical protein CTI18_07615 [Prevotella intermedia]|uniref:Uncharacterized protein n=1 Tax=Prevotella intermedia TaxID=28131 RepID=A0A2G8ICF3_PREIN|nr:hypothetical protein CTI18_07615 [Prevotella intermedia]